jgi:pimeloyl-ACP methyl ester carboxylesterase
MQQNHTPLQPPAVARLDALELPLLAVVGDLDDKNIERAADALVAAVPSGKKVILSGTAHLPNLERPEDFNRIVLSFLQGL